MLYLLSMINILFTVLFCPTCLLQFGTLLSRFTGWDLEHVMQVLRVKLYCSARVIHPSGASRTFWATETRYKFHGGRRRDFVEIDLGAGNIGLGQLICFVSMENVPERVPENEDEDPRDNSPEKVVPEKVVLIRWLSPSRLSQTRDKYNRPLCGYPLSSNHCLWEWSNAGSDRVCITRRGFRRIIQRQQMWSHVRESDRADYIDSEKRAFFDFIKYDSIIRFANVGVDPTTGHMLQTIQIV